MITKEEIIAELHKNKVNDIQFDPNGVCNAKCWYCPVKYEAQIVRQNTPVESMKIILDKIANERGKLFTSGLRNVYSSAFNEIVLYPYFEDLLRELEIRGLQTHIMSNGVAFTKKISDIIIKYNKAVCNIHFNVPAFEKLEWSKQTGFNVNLHETLVNNIQYVVDNVQDKIIGKRVSLVVNGYSEKSLDVNGGFNENLENFPDVDFRSVRKQTNLFIERFPTINVFPNFTLNDRDSYLEKNGIVSMSKRVTEINADRYVVNCKHSSTPNGVLVGRIYGWMHINCFGDAFLCCNDYGQRTKYGNILENSIEEVWFSDKHVDVIYNELTKGMCSVCISGRLNR